MKKFLVIIFLLAQLNTFAQSEYRFWVAKFGITHNIADPSPLFSPHKFILLDDNEFPVSPVSDYFSYNMSYSAEAQYHVDMKNEHIGFVIGAEYARYGISHQFITTNDQTLTETHQINAIGIPAFAKFSADLYRDQFYLFVGAQMNYNLSHSLKEKVSWLETKHNFSASKNELTATNLILFTGLNYKIFNIKVSYLPGSFFNPNYVATNDYGSFKPYESVQDGHFMFTTSITIPISEWLLLHSWNAEQLRRKIKYPKFVY